MKTTQKTLIMVMALMLIISMQLEVSAARHAERDIKIWINDFYVMSDVHPFVENGRTYVPVRFIAEELGYDVEWNGNNKTVSISKYEQKIQLAIDSNLVYVNNKQTQIDAPAKLKSQRTFVPIRSVVELFGESVEYDEVHKIAVIGNNFNPDESYPLKYYFKDKDPFITNSKVNFATYTISYSDGRKIKCNSDSEIFELIDEEAKSCTPLEFNSTVEKEKQLLDKYYVAPVENEPFVGSWYGKAQTLDSRNYIDEYVYIEKVKENEYLLTKRAIKSNGSELVVKCNAKLDESKNILKIERSFETTFATGDFDLEFYYTGADYIISSFDYIYDKDNQNLYLRKY